VELITFCVFDHPTKFCEELNILDDDSATFNPFLIPPKNASIANLNIIRSF